MILLIGSNYFSFALEERECEKKKLVFWEQISIFSRPPRDLIAILVYTTYFNKSYSFRDLNVTVELVAAMKIEP